jgi:hypothetical protein
MQQFVLCAIGATMCVLCFALGFIAAVVLGVADHVELRHAPAWLRGPKRAFRESPQEPRRETPRPPAATPVPAAAPAPVYRQPWNAPAPAVAVAEEPATIAEPAATAAPAPAPVEHPAAAATESLPGHMVYLFGDPEPQPVGAPVSAAPRPGPESNVRPFKPHAAPSRLTGSEIDLLPRRAAHGGDAHRRR